MKKKRVSVRYIFLFFSFALPLLASSYYAKIDPIDIYTIASNVQGEVLFADEEKLGKKLGKKPFIVIDSHIDKADLEATQKKISAIEEMIEADRKIIENLKKSLKRKEQNYKSVKDLSVKSKFQKDSIYFDLIASKNQLLNTQKELENYRSQVADLKVKQARLQKSIKDKTIAKEGYVLYELYVKKNDVATPGKPLAKVADTSKAILTLYVDGDVIKGIDKKTVYIDGKKTAYKASRVVPIADSVNLSKYKIQIITKAPKIFSKLVKVEIK